MFLIDQFLSALNHKGLRRYSSNMSWMFAERFLRLLGGLFVGAWLTRYLGPERFGTFSYVIAYVALFMPIAKLGLDEIVVHDLVYEPAKSRQFLGTAFWIKLCAGIALLIGIPLTAFISNNDSKINVYIFIIACGVLFQPFDVIDFYFQSRVSSKFVSLARSLQIALSSIIKIGLILCHADLFWFVITTLLEQLTFVMALMAAYKKQGLQWFFNSFDAGIFKQWVKRSWPLILSGAAIMAYMKIDQIMIKELLGAEELGLYSAALKLSEFWYFIPLIITSSVFPAIVNAKISDEKIYHLRLQRLYALLFWAAIFIAVGTTFLSDWLINTLYGNAYQASAQVLRIKIWDGVFVFLGVASYRWFISQNLERLFLINTLFAVIVNISLNFWLIPKYGTVGAAFAGLIAQFFSVYLSNYFFAQTRDNFYRLSRAPFLSRIL